MRVIAGAQRGRRLAVPPSARPMTDRVREAVFSSLGPEPVDQASVLDLYAGSGAIAIEALSRGAARAVLVDSDRVAVDVSNRNLASTGLDDVARVEARPVSRFVGGRPPREAPFDLVFADPPYELPDDELRGVFGGLAEPGWLAPGALVVIERSSRNEPFSADGWCTRWERKYGDTLVSVLAVAE